MPFYRIIPCLDIKIQVKFGIREGKNMKPPNGDGRFKCDSRIGRIIRQYYTG